MLYENIPRQFVTQPATKNTSKYYVYKNGLIRAKFADGTLRIGPGKNICFVAVSQKLNRQDQVRGSASIAGPGWAFADVMAKRSAFQDCEIAIKKPVDFYLDKNGKYDHGFHHGHRIHSEFDAKIDDQVVNESEFDAWIKERYADNLHGERLREDVVEERLKLHEIDGLMRRVCSKRKRL